MKIFIGISLNFNRFIPNLFFTYSVVLLLQFLYLSVLGFPSLTSTGTMVIVVDDVNDNVPVFDNDTFNTRISEDSPVGMVFWRITASDLDEGINGQLK